MAASASGNRLGAALATAVAVILILSSCSAPAPQRDFPTAERASNRGGATPPVLGRSFATGCPAGADCWKLDVPLDHFDDGNSDRQAVVAFAEVPSDDGRDVLMVLPGGPGFSAIRAADYYHAAFGRDVTSRYRLVLVDPRGTGLAPPRPDCAHAAAVDASGDLFEALTTGAGQAAAIRFGRDCYNEATAHGDLVSFVSARQIAGDLEHVRGALGVPRVTLFAESYGTVAAQVYAARYPDRVDALVLDSPLDLEASGPSLFGSRAGASDEAFAAVVDVCRRDESCLNDFAGVDPAVAFDRVDLELRSSPAVAEFPSPSGERMRFSFGAGDLELVAAASMSDPGTRMMFLRALAAASSRADFVPLQRLMATALDFDPATLQPSAFARSAVARYYAALCSDFEFPADDDAGLQSYGEDARSGVRGDTRFERVRYSGLPCLGWVDTEPVALPSPEISATILILAGELDSSAPAAQARRIAARSSASLLSLEGGGHALLAHGDACVTDAVRRALIEPRAPRALDVTCHGDVLASYAPLGPSDVSRDRLEEAVSGTERDLLTLPEYRAWSGAGPLAVGCPLGGTVRFAVAAQDVISLELASCAFIDGFAMTGHGSLEDGLLRLEAVSRFGRFLYRNEGYGERTLELSE